MKFKFACNEQQERKWFRPHFLTSENNTKKTRTISEPIKLTTSTEPTNYVSIPVRLPTPDIATISRREITLKRLWISADRSSFGVAGQRGPPARLADVALFEFGAHEASNPRAERPRFGAPHFLHHHHHHYYAPRVLDTPKLQGTQLSRTPSLLHVPENVYVLRRFLCTNYRIVKSRWV